MQRQKCSKGVRKIQVPEFLFQRSQYHRFFTRLRPAPRRCSASSPSLQPRLRARRPRSCRPRTRPPLRQLLSHDTPLFPRLVLGCITNIQYRFFARKYSLGSLRSTNFQKKSNSLQDFLRSDVVNILQNLQILLDHFVDLEKC